MRPAVTRDDQAWRGGVVLVGGRWGVGVQRGGGGAGPVRTPAVFGGLLGAIASFVLVGQGVLGLGQRLDRRRDLLPDPVRPGLQGREGHPAPGDHLREGGPDLPVDGVLLPRIRLVRATQCRFAPFEALLAGRQQNLGPGDLFVRALPRAHGRVSRRATPYVQTRLPRGELVLPRARHGFPFVGGGFSPVGDRLTLVGDGFPPVGGGLTDVGGVIPLLGLLLSFGGNLPPRVLGLCVVPRGGRSVHRISAHIGSMPASEALGPGPDTRR
ncbi:hypothetical protein ABT127_16205 [Streptomyces sp. NPDC001904]|uniref:hypothetical protein n=1 Tax=Streptomyces sp. NPDC001904 TaxID=3154531 RepID=UPI00332EF1B4